MKLKICIVLFCLYSFFVQASDCDIKENFLSSSCVQASDCNLRSFPSVVSSSSQLLNAMNNMRLSSREAETDADIKNLLIQERIDRKKALVDSFEKLKKKTITRGILKHICTKLQRHLDHSDNAIDEKIEEIRTRFCNSTGSSVYNVNPIWWIYSDREIRREGLDLKNLIKARLQAEQLSGSIEALAVQGASPDEIYGLED